MLTSFFFNDTATTEIYTLSLHDALPISRSSLPRPRSGRARRADPWRYQRRRARPRSEEHTSELQSRPHLVCRLLLEKKKKDRLSVVLFCSATTSNYKRHRSSLHTRSRAG